MTQTDEMQRMLRLHNEARKKLNLRPLSLHPKLHESAKQQALYMAQKGKKTHVGPGGSKIKERIRKVGYPLAGAHCAENAAAGGGELGAPDNVFHLWMESTDHRENILREDMQDVGFGSASGASGNGFGVRTSRGRRDKLWRWGLWSAPEPIFSLALLTLSAVLST